MQDTQKRTLHMLKIEKVPNNQTGSYNLSNKFSLLKHVKGI